MRSFSDQPIRILSLPVDTDTICAISTPPGTGAIALLRISGPRAFAVTERLAPTLPLEPLFRHAYFAPLIDMDGQFDEGVITLLMGPDSYSREDTGEIGIHGLAYVQQ